MDEASGPPKAAPSSTVLTKDEPAGTEITATTETTTKTKADTAAAEEGASSEDAESRAELTADGGRWGSVRRALGPSWVRHLILILVYQGAGIAATWPRFTWL
ncbi:MAG: hypothetical protein LBV34_17855, partial [Nocardiopsaceae bacterium]|nr:hypothetical protein [Nocardiopsaceae bacterium]